MIVFYRNGVPVLVTGWRAWLIMLATTLFMVLAGTLMAGFALTVLTVFLFILPVAVLLGVVLFLFKSKY